MTTPGVEDNRNRPNGGSATGPDTGATEGKLEGKLETPSLDRCVGGVRSGGGGVSLCPTSLDDGYCTSLSVPLWPLTEGCLRPTSRDVPGAEAEENGVKGVETLPS